MRVLTFNAPPSIVRLGSLGYVCSVQDNLHGRMSSEQSIRAMSSKKMFRVTVQTDPPNAESANEEARWGKLADLFLKPGASTNETRPTSKTHQDHERLKEELKEALDRHDEGNRWKRAG